MTAAALEANRVASRERYWLKYRRPDAGPWGGARKCPPACGCRRHGPVRHAGMATAEREGDVVRLSCSRCGRGPAGTLADETIEAWMRAHRHRARNLPTRARQMEIR